MQHDATYLGSTTTASSPSGGYADAGLTRVSASFNIEVAP